MRILWCICACLLVCNFLVGVAAKSVGFMMFFGISIVMPLGCRRNGLYGCIGRSCSARQQASSTGPVASIHAGLRRSDPRDFRRRRLSGAGRRLVHARRATIEVDFFGRLAQLVTGLGIALFIGPAAVDQPVRPAK